LIKRLASSNHRPTIEYRFGTEEHKRAITQILSTQNPLQKLIPSLDTFCRALVCDSHRLSN